MKVLRFITVVLLFTLISLAVSAQFFSNKTITEINGEEYLLEDLYEEDVVFLIASLTCGYCLMEIPFYNQLSENFSHKLKFVVLLENNTKYVEGYMESGKPFYDQNWIVTPQSMRTIRRMWKKKVFPEYHIYSKGKLIKSFAYSNKKTREEVYAFLKNL